MSIRLLACVAALAAGCGQGSAPAKVVSTTGTIEFQDLEGGAWLIRTDDGALYAPINLADSLKQAGARVQVTLIERPDLAGIPLPGVRAEIVSISILGGAAGGRACDPPAAATSGAGDAGCSPLPTFQICEQSDTAGRCADACPATDYPLRCQGSTPSGIPSPDPALRCRVIPVPTPATVAFHCCPCTP